MSLQGKTVVVTGGLGALGQVVVETAAARGASVAVLDHATQVPEGLAERLGAKALFLGGIDLSSPAEAEKAMGAVKAKFGRIDALLNHFSVSQPTSADKSAFLARWDAINDVVHAIAARMGGSFSAECGASS